MILLGRRCSASGSLDVVEIDVSKIHGLPTMGGTEHALSQGQSDALEGLTKAEAYDRLQARITTPLQVHGAPHVCITCRNGHIVATLICASTCSQSMHTLRGMARPSLNVVAV